MKFKELKLKDDILKSLDDLGFEEPSPIQEKAIPLILKSKKDLIALAQTGTGKTAAFALPILQQIENSKDPQAIIICPTRELCMQISKDIKTLGKHSKGIFVTAVYGGERIDLQIRDLRRGSNIIVGTPGRLNDLIRRGVLKLNDIKWLVLDEADEMLDMGFKEDLDTILEETPKDRQTLLFSATMSRTLQGIAKKYMKDSEEISVGERNTGAENVEHEYFITTQRDRFEALKRIIDHLPGIYGILFCRTRNETQEIADRLKQSHYSAEPLHGEISQNMRTKIMNRFKDKKIQLLVATDVAARGIDVSDLTHVINYNLPDQNESYTHRSGRTGRAQKKGVSIAIVTQKEIRRIHEIEKKIGKTFKRNSIPTGDIIFAKQIESYIEEINNTDTTKIDGKDLDHTFETLKKNKKDDLIKKFIAHRFIHLLNEKENNRNINADYKAPSGKIRSDKRVGDSGVNLKINFGRKHGSDVKNLLSLINSNKNLRGLNVGRIVLMPEFSVFSVERDDAEKVMKYLNGSHFKGREIKIEKDHRKPNNNYRGNNRGRRFKR